MLKHRELSSPSSCLNRADENEPVFVLRANDELAPGAVRHWAAQYIATKGGWEAMTGRQHTKYQEAMKLADQMDEWLEAKNGCSCKPGEPPK